MDVSGPSETVDTEVKKAGDAEPLVETWQGEQYTVIKEGQANILYPAGHQVFYNPVQEYNRDMSVMMLRLFAEEWHVQQGKPLRILEALAATGLRSVRYAKEIEGLDFVMANDLDPTAVAAIHRNRDYNGIEETKLRTTLSDAAFLMHKMRNDTATQSEAKVDNLSVVDLDPYGGASPFLDGAVSVICDGGLLAVTCTDLAVLCGNYAEACWAKYGAMPPKRTEYCHEMALRIVLGSIASHAARHHRHIVPVMSMFADFYVRVFVRVYKHGGELKKVPSKMGYVMQCTCCDAREVQKIGKFAEPTPGNVKFSQGYAPVVDQKCSHCEGAWKMGGPMWMEPIHDRAVLERALAHLESPDAAAKYGTYRRMLGTITNMLDELPDAPFFYTISQLANTLHLQTPKLDALRSAIVSLGYRVSATHCAAGAVKTDAPTEAIYDVMRSWHKLHPAKLDGQERTPAYKILTKPLTRVANFTIIDSARSITHAKNGEKLGRYPIHPPNWGPGSRAGRKRDATSMADELAERRKENQGRTTKKKSKQAEVPLAEASSSHVIASDDATVEQKSSSPKPTSSAAPSASESKAASSNAMEL
jgi:tRNA (guanine26-N2/guanine27-N2)-dimethyltransferase